MGHTEISNNLPYEFGVLHLSDLDGLPVAVAVTKATYGIGLNVLALAEKQEPILHSGKPNGEPGKSSYRYEPECAFFKPNTDVVLIAAAMPPQGSASQVDVDFSVGSLRRQAIVFGHRFWFRGFTDLTLAGPEPFESMPLVYERSFGGWDRSDPDPQRHTFDPRNPVGCGFQKKFARGEDKLPLPNIEDPQNLIRDIRSMPQPVGFGFTSPDWQPRGALAGTYDANWEAKRMPLPPLDFNPRFFNAASPGMVANGYLAGDESVRVGNCSKKPVLTFDLPGIAPPVCRFRVAGQQDQVPDSHLDTVVVNVIDEIVVLTWRCYVRLPKGPEQLLELHVGS